MSPAGRIRGRRCAAPTAFVVAAAGRPVAEGRALRADTKRRGAPFTKARVRGTRKRQGRSSRHENASPLARILNWPWRRLHDHEFYGLARIQSVFVKIRVHSWTASRWRAQSARGARSKWEGVSRKEQGVSAGGRHSGEAAGGIERKTRTSTLTPYSFLLTPYASEEFAELSASKYGMLSASSCLGSFASARSYWNSKP